MTVKTWAPEMNEKQEGCKNGNKKRKELGENMLLAGKDKAKETETKSTNGEE